MKRIFTILAAVFLTATLWAQSPEKMSYQAVIRDASDNLATNQTIGMQISILQGSASGTAVYTETQEPTTNANGLVTIEIGNGSTLDTFANIDWSTDTYFIKTETDPTGGINYTITGVSQLLSVPYALHAKTAETVTGGITESDPVYTTSEAANITASDISNLGNLSGTNSGNQDISGIVTNQQAIQDTASQIRADIPDVSGFVSTESDPTFTSSQAVNITASDISNLGNLSGTNSGDQDISGIVTNQQAIQDTASQIRADIPDVSGFVSTESDPTFTSSQAVNITASDISNLGNLSGTNSGDQDISGIVTNQQAIQDTASQIRADIPDVSGFVSTESDPVYTTSEAAKITASDITNLGNLSGTNSGDQDITGIATNTQAIQDTASQIRADIPTVATYSVGDFAQGGIVFWVDETGQHGLVCAKEDQDGGSGMRWDAGTYGRTRATGNGLFAGELNTAIIISSQVSIGDDGHDYAAQICNYLQITQNSVIYGDWYLPSKYELNLMWTNESTINATALENSGSSIASAYNWSSTESSSSSAWKQTFGNGFQSYYNKYHTSRVRAVRAF
jgi:hypothetical protein